MDITCGPSLPFSPSFLTTFSKTVFLENGRVRAWCTVPKPCSTSSKPQSLRQKKKKDQLLTEFVSLIVNFFFFWNFVFELLINIFILTNEPEDLLAILQ
jgi:hypothetical protein